MPFWVRRTVTRARHVGDAISSTTILAVKGHAPAHGREPVSGSHVGRSASGQGRFKIIILAFR